jgi:hypothetical protein
MPESENPWNELLGYWDNLYPIFCEAVRHASPEMKRSLLDELMHGKASDKHMIAVAVGRTADADMVAAMHRHLTSSPDPVNAWYVLMAFAARTDLPLTDEEEHWPIYRRHLRSILDPASKEVRWWAAVALARELPDPGPIPDLDLGCGVFPPRNVPMESLTPEAIIPKGSKIPWPMTADSAVEWKRRITGPYREEAPYAVALLLHWHRTGRQTLPYYPFEVGDLGSFGRRVSSLKPFARPRGQEQAKQILEPAQFSSDVPWTCVVIGTGPRTEPGRLIAAKSGRGPVTCTMTVDLPGSSEGSTFKLGVRSELEGPARNPRESMLTVVVDARLEKHPDGGYAIDGSHHSGLGGSQGGGGLQAYGRLGEATVLDIEVGGRHSSSGVTDSENLHQAFTLILPGVGPDADLEKEWRQGIVRFLTRWADAPDDVMKLWGLENRAFWDHFLEQMLQLTSWIPIEEAKPPLQQLWKRRAILKGEPDFKQDPTLAQRVGVSLLMAGDDAPLDESDLLTKFPDTVALRLFLHSPHPKVRAAVEAQAAEAVSDPIARDLVQRLNARGDSTSRVSKAARTAERKHVLETIPEALPFFLFVTVLIAAAWLPGPRGSSEAKAASLVLIGLILQFLTLEYRGRIWLPFAGDLCFLAAATLERRRAMQVLATLMAVSGLVSFLLPESPWAGSVGRLLFAVYLAWLSLRHVSHPARSFLVSAAHLATWVLMIVPLTVGSLADLLMPRIVMPWTLIQLQGCGAWLYVAAMFLSPLVIVYSWRYRAIPKPPPPPPQPEYPEGVTS